MISFFNVTFYALKKSMSAVLPVAIEQEHARGSALFLVNWPSGSIEKMMNGTKNSCQIC